MVTDGKLYLIVRLKTFTLMVGSVCVWVLTYTYILYVVCVCVCVSDVISPENLRKEVEILKTRFIQYG